MISPTYISLCLKLMGVVFILSFFLDAATFLFPFTWQESAWQISVVTAVVDRGVVPLVGIAVILIGYWIDAASGSVKKSSTLLPLSIYVIATFLGLIFLLLVPVHLNNLNQAKTTALEQIAQGVGQGEQQIQGFLANLNNISKNPQQLDQQIAQRQQVLSAGQIQGQQLTTQQIEELKAQTQQLQNLRNLTKQPAEFKKRVEEIKNQLNTQLADRKREAESQAKTQALKQGLRIGLSSLMLAIVYSAVGWLGLVGLKNMQPSSKDARR
jgi:hypothetical protein